MNNLNINGKSYHGNNIQVTNNRVIIDGKDVTDKDMPSTILTIEVEGTIQNLITDASVNCEDVMGDLKAGGSVNCDDVTGNITAGGSVNCDDVNGNINAKGSINHG